MNRAEEATSATRRRPWVAGATITVTGVALAAAYFPLMFNQWVSRDDEGVFVFALRESLARHGHLYSTIWSDLYGPFYYLFMSAVFRLIHQQPSLENGRWIVLVLTAASSGVFGAAVWRLTKSLPASLLCQVATFLILIKVQGDVPMHPGSLGAFLLSIVAFGVASYAANPRTAHLVTIGIALGALVMTKVNVGGLAAVALVFAFCVGNRRTPRWLQAVVALAAVLVPFGLVSQNIDRRWAATFAIVVSVSLVEMIVLAVIDPLEFTRWPLVPIAAGALGAVVCSFAFPLATGTPFSDVVSGVFVRPLTFANALAVPAYIRISLTGWILTVLGVGAAVVFRRRPSVAARVRASWVHVVLAVVALWVLGLGVTTYAARFRIARWLPALVLLPAIVICCDGPDRIRRALRILVALAILQMLVAYPVPGVQVGWGTVAMAVPCAIALAVAVDCSRLWRDSHALVRGSATLLVCLVLVLAGSMWPVGMWRGYQRSVALDLPGTGLIRIDPKQAATVREVVVQLRAHCDTFYGNPDLNSFYIFTRLPPVTTMLADGGTTALTAKQQRQVINSLEEKTAAGERVCVLRDGSVSGYDTNPLALVLNQYLTVVVTVSNYSISQHN